MDHPLCGGSATGNFKSMKPYYDHAGITLYLGNCREILPQIEQADHLITDPPYSDYVHSNSRTGSTKGGTVHISEKAEFGFDSLTDELRLAVSKWARISVTRWQLVFSDIESCHLWRTDLAQDGIDYVRTGAWIKRLATPQFTGDRPGAGLETVTICHKSGRKRWNGGGKLAVWTHEVVNRKASDPRIHPTQKPLSLMSELIELFTEPGELIIDPFAGSATTLMAAKVLQRRSIGIELDEKHAETAAYRLSQDVMDFTPT